MYKRFAVVLAVAVVLSPANAFVGVHVPGQVMSKPSILSHNVAARPNRMALRSIKMQEQQPGDYDAGQEAVPPPPSSEQNQQINTGGAVPWFERTTTLDRSLRVGGDPLAPKKNPVKRDMSTQMAKMEEDGYNWYKSQESKRSMFGRTLNPLTGALEDPDESAAKLNVFEDPIFYVILIVGAPVAIMVGAAYACVVPGLSMAFGAQCDF